MAAPAVSLFYNDLRVKISWEVDRVSGYQSFNLYWSSAGDMSGEALIKGLIPNQGGSLYGKSLITYEFTRESLGLTSEDPFYLRIKGVDPLGVEDVANPGPTRLIVALSTKLEEFNSAQTYGFDYTNRIWRKVATS